MPAKAAPSTGINTCLPAAYGTVRLATVVEQRTLLWWANFLLLNNVVGARQAGFFDQTEAMHGGHHAIHEPLAARGDDLAVRRGKLPTNLALLVAL